MKKLTRFLLFVLLFSVPLWLAAILLDMTKIIPVKLPFSALQFLSVLLAAIIVMRKEKSTRKLLSQGIDFYRIKQPVWRVVIFVLMPVIVTASFFVSRIFAQSADIQMTPIYIAPIFLLIYGFSGYCEQIGWTAVMTETLLERRSILLSGLLVGITWAIWHIIPFMQTHNTASWIFWQCIFTVIYRVMLTKVYILTNRSVFSAVAMHATYNTAFSLLPYYGSSYHPASTALVTLIATVLIYVLPVQNGKESDLLPSN
ncbi:CPBP family intramembrane metalloprotease [Oscillospiraceae bacterium CM]|nr:CPBP family intramembrane metalloprotease [Oscillospiraceae bacterium CM]